MNYGFTSWFKFSSSMAIRFEFASLVVYQSICLHFNNYAFFFSFYQDNPKDMKMIAILTF